MKLQPADYRLAGRQLSCWVLVLTVTIVVVALDLATKSLAFEHLADQPVVLDRNSAVNRPVPPPESVTIVPYLLSLRLTLNTGAVFGIGQGAQWFFVIVSVAAVVVIARVFWVSHAHAWGTHLSLALILSGALGNLFDRLCFNAVRDMLWLFPNVKLPFGWRWGAGGSDQLYPWIFNVADVSLVFGVGLMFILMWRRQQSEPADQTGPD